MLRELVKKLDAAAERLRTSLPDAGFIPLPAMCRPKSNGAAAGIEHEQATSTAADSSETIAAALKVIDALNPELDAFVSLRADAAQAEAATQQARVQLGEPAGPLHGFAFGVKDNIDVAGMETTQGAREPFHRHAEQDAVVVARLRAAGAIAVGKTNLHEFAWGGTTENEVFGASKNPWDIARNAHGSSGGSAVAVASGMVTFALGTDTGGSIRNPAAVTGVTGLRPSMGLVDLSGTAPLAWSMDTIGPLARSAGLVRRVLEVMADSTLPPSGAAFQPRVLIDSSMTETGVDAGVQNAYVAAVEHLTAAGLEVVEADLSDLEGHCEAWLITQAVESAVVHHRELACNPQRFSTEVRVQMLAGAALSAPGYLIAQQFRQVLRHRVRAHLNNAQADAILMPTSARVANLIGDDPLEIAQSRFDAGREVAVFTSLASALAYPALSVPCGFSEGLPVGMQLVGLPDSDAALLDIGEWIQAHSFWHREVPPLARR